MRTAILLIGTQTDAMKANIREYKKLHGAALGAFNQDEAHYFEKRIYAAEYALEQFEIVVSELQRFTD